MNEEEKAALRKKSDDIMRASQINEGLTPYQTMYELVLAFIEAGFTEKQAMWIVVDMVVGGH